MAGGKIDERIDLLPAATAQNAAAEKEQGDIRTERCAQFVPRGKVQMVAAQSLEAQNRGRGIGAGAAQAAAQRNHLLDLNLNSAVPATRLRPRFACAIGQIAGPTGNRRVIAINRNSLPSP